MSTEIERAAREAAVRLQLNRVLSALKIDPWDVLDVPYTATDSECARAYRNLSLQCHPDKVDGALKEDAQAAFSKLAQAKEDISNAEKKAELEVFIARAKDKVEELKKRLEEEAMNKARKTHGPAAGIEVQPEPIKLDFNVEWRKECRELLIEHEWRKRQQLRQQKDMEIDAAKEAQEKKRKREAEDKHEEDWEDARDARVSSWRTFGKQLGKKPKPPKQFSSDGDKTFVRRVANPNDRA